MTQNSHNGFASSAQVAPDTVSPRVDSSLAGATTKWQYEDFTNLNDPLIKTSKDSSPQQSSLPESTTSIPGIASSDLPMPPRKMTEEVPAQEVVLVQPQELPHAIRHKGGFNPAATEVMPLKPVPEYQKMSWAQLNHPETREGHLTLEEYQAEVAKSHVADMEGLKSSIYEYTRSFVKSMSHKIIRQDQEQQVDKKVKHEVIFMLKSIKALQSRKSRKQKLVMGGVYFVFMLIFFVIAVLQRHVLEAYGLQSALSDNIRSIKTAGNMRFNDISDTPGIFLWLETALLPSVFPPPEWYNGDPASTFDRDYFLGYNRIIGGLKLVQRRVDPTLCYDDTDQIVQYFNSTYTKESSPVCSKRFNEYYPILYPDLTPEHRSKERFGPTHDRQKYRWQSDEHGGGFYVFTNNDPVLTRKLISELWMDRWIDKSTRRLEITFDVYNGNYRLFSHITATFKILPTGSIDPTIRMDTFRLENYLQPVDKFRLALEVVFAGYVLVCLLLEVTRMVYAPEIGFSIANVVVYFAKWTSYLDLTRLALFVWFLSSWLRICTHNLNVDLELPLPVNKSIDFDPLIKLYQMHTITGCLSIMVCMLSFFKYVHHSPKYGILIRTITYAARDLLQYVCLFVIIWCTFAIMGMLMFGAALKEWSTFRSAVHTMISMMTVEYGLGPLIQVNRRAAVLFYILFLVVVYFVLVNVLLAILIDAYSRLQVLNKQAKYEEQDRIQVGLLKELFSEAKFSVLRIGRKLLGREQVVDHSFVTTDEMYIMLDKTTDLKRQAICVPGVPTSQNPAPAPEYVVTYAMLEKVFPAQRARLLMAVLGDPWIEPPPPKTEPEPIEVIGWDLITCKKQLDTVRTENEELKREIQVVHNANAKLERKLDQVIDMLTPKHVPPPPEDPYPELVNRNAPYNAIYNQIYRNL